MHLGSGRSRKLKDFFQNRSKKFWIPVFTFVVTALGFGIFMSVRALTAINSQVTIDITSTVGGYNAGDNFPIYYGINPQNTSRPWMTRRYSISSVSTQAMCLEASKTDPSGNGDVDTVDSDILKQIMLVTNDTIPNNPYYGAFASSHSWSSIASSITNLMDGSPDLSYGGTCNNPSSDPRASYSPTCKDQEEKTKYSDYYWGCTNYYAPSCTKTTSNVNLSDAIFAIGHMMASATYGGGDYYGLTSADQSIIGGLQGNGSFTGLVGTIDAWFSSNNYSVEEWEVYTAQVSSGAQTKQTVGWLEYKGPSTGKFKICKKSDTGENLSGAVFTIGSQTYTTGSDGCTGWIEVDPQTITYYETTAPSGYVGYTSAQTCTIEAGDEKTCEAHTNSKIPTAYIKLRKLISGQNAVNYAGLTVEGTVFSVKNSSNTEVATITIGTNTNGYGYTNVALPAGTYTITEKTATTGFSTNSTSLTVTLNSGNTSTSPSTSNAVDATPSTAVTNDFIKGKISLVKTGYELGLNNQASSRNLSGVYFEATNNANTSLKYCIGPTASNGSVTSGDMIYGTYTIKELSDADAKSKCSAPASNISHNFAYNLITINNVEVHGSGTYSQGTKNDELPDTPDVQTDARNSDPSASPQNELEISANAGVTDHITCSGLISGASYQIRGELYGPSSNSPIVSKTETFTADGSGGCTTINSNTGDMVFPTIDTSHYIDKTLSIKQYLYKNNGTTANPDWVLIFIHNNNLNETREQVKVKNIEIKTTANSERSINNKELAAGKVKILDTYEIIGLTNGQTFTLTGTVKDASGNTIATANDTINYTGATGAKYTGVMTFEFDSTPYVGQTLYVHQTLESSTGTTLANHTGTAQNGQTVTVLTPELITNATSAADGTRELNVGTADVQDKVTYKGLASGSTYTIKGELWKLNAAGTAVEGSAPIARATDSFTASSEDDLTTGRTLTFTNIDAIANCAVDNRLTLPCRFVVFEYIYYGSNSSYFQKHEQVNDSNQTVSVKDPILESDATDSQNDIQALPVGRISVHDKITYGNLVPSQEYKVQGKLIDLSTGQVVKDLNGSDLISIKEPFHAAGTSGSLTVDSFQKFDSVLDYNFALGNNQRKYVIYQTLYYGDIILKVHEQNDDPRQTLQLTPPTISTTATYEVDGSNMLGVGKVVMEDIVAYSGLVEDDYYTARCYIIDPETGDIVNIGDTYFEGYQTFKAGSKGAGQVSVKIPINTTTLQGQSFVVYEELYRSPRDNQNDDRLLAEHKEELGGAQTITVKVIKLETTATDLADGDNVLAHEDGQTIHDVVEYDGVLTNEDYIAYGYLWDETDGQPLLDKDGKRIEASSAFTTSRSRDKGTVEMDFPVDAYDLPGHEIVVYEYLFQGTDLPLLSDGTPDFSQAIAKHTRDNEDKPFASQTVKVSMRVGTTAADVYDGDQIIGVGREAKVIDNLAYEGAKMGETYKAKGWLVYQDTGEPAKGVKVTCTTPEPAPEEPEGDEPSTDEPTDEGTDDEPADEPAEDEEPTPTCTREYYDIVQISDPFVIGTTGFEETSGAVPLTFTFDSRELIGKKLVVYEELYHVKADGTEELVAEHKDLNDEGQTVTVATPTIHTVATDKADGDKELLNDADIVILDKVDYEGLVIGTTYTLRGVLVDKKTGERISGGTTEVNHTFTATRDSGTEELEFAINTDGMSGHEIVVFETLYIDETPDDDNKIAEHEDLDDDNQTVWIKVTIPDTGFFTRLLDGAKQAGIYIVVGGAAIAIASVYGYRRLRSRRRISF